MTVQRRRRLFWTLFQVNIWEVSATVLESSVTEKLKPQSLGTGRPPVIYEPTLINCLFQLDPNTEPTPEHSKPSSDAHGFEVTRDLTARVVVATSMIEPPHYQEILALDASIRARWMPSSVVNSYLDVKIGALKRLVICAPYRPLCKILKFRSSNTHPEYDHSAYEPPPGALRASRRGFATEPDWWHIQPVVSGRSERRVGGPGMDP
jgi:hypothetical protein